MIVGRGWVDRGNEGDGVGGGGEGKGDMTM